MFFDIRFWSLLFEECFTKRFDVARYFLGISCFFLSNYEFGTQFWVPYFEHHGHTIYIYSLFLSNLQHNHKSKFLFCLGVFYKLIWTANFCNDLFHLFKHKPHHKLKNYLISKNCHHFYLIYHLKMRSIMVNDLLIEQVIYLSVLLTNSWRQLEIKIN